MKYAYPVLVFILWGCSYLDAQKVEVDDFLFSGEALRTGSNCIRLTPDQAWASGSIWYKDPIDLESPFEMELKIMMGCKDEQGADGIVFVFHPKQQRTGYQGEGMGFAGLKPSLGIEIDTWTNEHLGDPYQDHIALLRNGQVDHRYGLTKALPIPNVEDCREHPLKVSWAPRQQALRILLDNRQVLYYQGDIVDEIFGGNGRAYWGITAATGAYNNRQEICFERLQFEVLEKLPPMELDGPKAEKLLSGEIVLLQNLRFNTGSTTLIAASRAELDKLAALMKRNPKLKLDIFGHTDNVGSASTNLKLSQRRAQAIADYLKGRGVPESRLNPRGFGEAYPIAPNTTSEGRLKNRRIEFRLSRPIP